MIERKHTCELLVAMTNGAVPVAVMPYENIMEKLRSAYYKSLFGSFIGVEPSNTIVIRP